MPMGDILRLIKTLPKSAEKGRAQSCWGASGQIGATPFMRLVPALAYGPQNMLVGMAAAAALARADAP